MPELPDLEVLIRKLKSEIEGSQILKADLFEPLVLRMMVEGSFSVVLKRKHVVQISRKGPFVVFDFGNVELIVHCMLAGAFQLVKKGEKALSFLCFTLEFDNGCILNFGDRKRMAKVYLAEAKKHSQIPGFNTQGVDILSPDFTFQMFFSLIRGRRNQVRVFLMDQSLLSAVGNAYADEILFHAGVHPKTLCSALSDQEKERLYESIREVISWGTEEVEKAGKPIEKKVRDHVRIRNRKGENCLVCGSIIRRAQVHGYDTFFCPVCQPAKGKQFIPWDRKLSPDD